ncbi:hypothetical protein Tco_1089066, partial [Tanacetum coccineum]
CHADEPLAVPLDGLHLDDKLHFVEEPLEIVDHEVKRLKRSWIPLVKVRRNSKRGPEFTWEREDQFKKKYPHFFTKTTPSSSAASGNDEKKGEEFGLDSKDDDVVPRVEEVPLVDEVLVGAFGGGMIVSFSFFEGLDEEAWVDAMDVLRFEGKEEDDDEE